MLQKRKLGNTGLEVSCLALGGLPLCRAFARGETKAIIRRAAELGINFIDTAPSYHDSEDAIGEALSRVDAEFLLGTKMGNLPAQNYQPRDRAFLRHELEMSLKRLRRERVDIVYVHEPDRPEFYQWWNDDESYEGPVLDVLHEFREAGRIGFLGLGGTTTTEMARIVASRKFDVVLSAFQYSLLWREAEFSVFPAVRETGIGLVCGSPLQQGALSQIFWHDVAEKPMRWLSEPRRRQFIALYELVHDSRISLPELALRFVLSNPEVASVLTGVDSVEKLEANVAAAERGPLPADLLRQLREIYNMVPFRPFGEPFNLYFAEALNAARKESQGGERK